MNYLFNKNPRFFRKPNDRYFIKLDKSEVQSNINKMNNLNNQNNIIKSTNVYKSNFFALNRIINTKDIMKNYNNNYNNLRKENSKKYPYVKPSHSIENNLKCLNITNIKNIEQKPSFSYNKQKNVKEDNKKNENQENDKESIPTIVKIQKLIEKLQKNNSKNNIISKENKESKENNKLPHLVSIQKIPIIEPKLQIEQTHKTTINNINIFSTKDLISRVNNTKIKLKQINNNKINKNNNKNINNIEDNIISITKKSNVPKIRKPKISIDNVKNIIKQNLIIDNNGNKEKVVNIRLKLNPIQTRNYFNMNNKINNNTIFMNTKKESVKFCMSNYNNYEGNLMNLKNTFHHFEKERNKKDLLVNKNQTMLKNPLNDKKYKEENQEELDELENDPKRYSKYYLPSSGFGLLSRHNN